MTSTYADRCAVRLAGLTLAAQSGTRCVVTGCTEWAGRTLPTIEPSCRIAVASDVGYGVLVTGTSFDSTCYAGTDKLRCADVALAFPSSSPFCSGTLVAGPQDRTFIVTARHCAETMWEFIVYPMSSYYVLFDYRLPCNATEARPGSFQKVAQVHIRLACFGGPAPTC